MLSVPDKNQLLRRVWLFSELDEGDLSRVAGVARERACPAGEVLVRQGDASNDLFTVIRGRLKVGSVMSEGDEVLLAVMGPGDVFGELALLDDKPRSATVIAAEPCRLLVVPGPSFRPLLLEAPRLGLKLLQVMASHVRRLSARTEDNATLSVRARLAKTLLDLAARFGSPATGGGIRINLRLSQQELGRFVGATREMVNKCLRDWARLRVVRRGRGLLVVQNCRYLEGASIDSPVKGRAGKASSARRAPARRLPNRKG
jgi:CRP/FNR family transcriptional regulator, cyclic AMP receptor protein